MDMIRITFLILMLSTFCAGCSHTVLVYDPVRYDLMADQKILQSQEASGNVSGLRDILADDKEVELIFIHGVGDHCPGWALGIDDAPPKSDVYKVPVAEAFLNEKALSNC